MTALFFLIGLVCGLLGAGAALAGMIALQKMQAEWRELREAVRRLEAGSGKRNPYKTNDGLEDATAVIQDATWQAMKTLEYLELRMGQAKEIMRTIRRDPEAFDAERPNQKKEVI